MRTHELLSKPRVSVKEMRVGMEILEPADTLRGNAPVKRIKITSIEFKRFPKHGVIVNEKFSYDHSSEVWLDAFVDLYDSLSDIGLNLDVVTRGAGFYRLVAPSL